jgi:NADPH:quinone reductase-like Zn-dependent oxidoreductase
MFNHVTDASALTSAVAFVEGAVKQGLRPVIDQVFGWSEALDAYRRLDSQAQIGKIIVSMEHGK